jgi:Pyridoxamine 5'-phosphate oxidase
MRTKNLAERYDLPPVDWSLITDRLDAGLNAMPGSAAVSHHSYWLATINADGSPHVTGLGALWVDGTFWFTTGQTTRKGRNLDRDPRCALSIGADEFELTVEGDAHLVTDPQTVARLAAIWVKDWPCKVDDSGVALTADYSAPSAGGPPWSVYRITIRSATALALQAPGGATRWDFDPA